MLAYYLCRHSSALARLLTNCFAATALSGGFNWFAFQMLTGCDTQVFQLEGQQSNNQGGEWRELFTAYADTPYSIEDQNTAMNPKIVHNEDASDKSNR
jgi:hypothetical protein